VNRSRKQHYIKRAVAFAALSSFLFFSPINNAAGQDAVIKLKVVAEQANIRLEPDISSIIIRQVPQGTILNATEKREDWFAVLITPKEGTTVSGYVHESLVILIEPIPEKIIPPKEKEEAKPVHIPQTIEPDEPREKSPFQWTLAVLAGGNYLSGGDFNRGIIGIADLYQDILGAGGEGEVEPVHLGYVFGMDVTFSLSDSLSWGIRAEHFQGKNESEVDYSQGLSSSALLIQPNLQATPINLFLSYTPAPYLYVKGGISYTFARCSYTYRLESDELIQQREGKATAGGAGLSGSLGFIRHLSSSLSFFAEIAGRYATIKGFKGNEEFQDSTGASSAEKGRLYLAQMQILADRTHPVLFIRETRPNEAGIISAEEARIDLSGVSVVFGLRFHF